MSGAQTEEDLSTWRILIAEDEPLVAEVVESDLRALGATVKQLSGLLPICMHCKRIRDQEGAWQVIEKYITGHSAAELTHGICDQCRDTLYPE